MMTTRDVLIAARGVQERRGYDWNNGGATPGPCCPGASIAAVLAQEDFDVPHLARDALEEQFTCSCGLAEDYRGGDISSLSHTVGCEECYRGYEFTLPEILGRYDKAIEGMSLPGPWREVEIVPTKQPEEIPQEAPAEPVEAPPEKVPA